MSETNSTQGYSVRKIFQYSGTYFAAVAGAGFASGQEVLQFFSYYGVLSLIGIIPTTIMFMYFGKRFIELGHQLKTDSHSKVIEYLCGKHVGKVIDWILTFFIFGCFVLMVSGGGATMTQHYDLNPYIGRIIMVVISVIGVSFGFSTTVKIGSVLAPTIVLAAIGVSIYSGFPNIANLSEVTAILENLDISRSTPSIWISVLIYVSFCLLPNLPVLVSIGNAETDKKLMRHSGYAGGLILGLCLFFINLALLTNFDSVHALEIPLMEMANIIWSPLGAIFSVVLLAAIYTTAVAFLYGAVTRFATAGTRKALMVTVAFGIASFFLGLVPFATLVGTVYPLLGYMGLIVIASLIYLDIRRKFIDKNERNINAPAE